MGFTFEEIGIEQAREQFATTRETKLSQVCAAIVKAFNDAEQTATPAMSLAMLETMDNDFSDWQTRQRDRRANPQEEGDDKAQVISVDAIARKINADKDKTDVRAIRKNGGVAFVKASLWKPEDEEAEADSDAS